MSKFIKYVFGLLLVLSFHGCTDFVEPAIPYNNFDTGVYLRTLSQTSSFNFFQLSTAKLTLMVEAVDIQDGKLVKDVEVFVNRRRGASLTPEKKVKTVTAADFKSHTVIIPDVHPASGSKYPAATIEVTIQEALTAMGLTLNDINGGDFIEFRLSLNTTDGRTFTNSNLSGDVAGGAYYRSPFFYRIPVVCPSELEGTMDYVQTSMFCPGQISGTVTWTKASATTYKSSDFSFGSWVHCYGASGGVPGGTLTMSDACGVISMTGTDQYGDRYTYKIDKVEGTKLTITWSNTYGEFGTVVLTRKDGKNWPALRN